MPTHWKKLTNPNYLGAYSIENGQDLILTIDYIREETVIGADGKKDDKVVCHFKEKVKPMILNPTNMKTIHKLFGTPYIEDWQGKQIQIGMEKVKAFGEIMEALRVRNFKPRVNAPKCKCESCGKDIQPYGKSTAAQMASYTRNKYGKALCAACATAEAERMNNNAD